nr:UDP-glycosyltransferase 87A1-like [Tanacetum cinerariifolium]
MVGPFENVLDKMEVDKVTLIVVDVLTMWMFEVANKRNIPIAAFYPMSGENMEKEEGFTAALAVLVTEASQSRQHGMRESVRQSLTD